MIYVIGGTTASGKSSLAFQFAEAVNGVIINADAFAVYKELIIGTAKPSDEELKRIQTYMFNIRSINESFSIYDYQTEVREIINKYEAKKQPIIIVGGSGLYIRSVLYDYQFQKEEEPLDETKYIDLSNIELHQRLVELDPLSAQTIHPNNRKRVLRALFIAETSSKTKSEQQKKQQEQPLYNYELVILDLPKEQLNEKIQSRVKKMFLAGLRLEVEQLTAQFPANLQALQAIGYKEINEYNAESDEFLINLITNKTIKYAKRQRTFFRNQFKGTFFYSKKEALTFLLSKHKEYSNAKNE